MKAISNVFLLSMLIIMVNEVITTKHRNNKDDLESDVHGMLHVVTTKPNLPFTAFWNVPSYNCSHVFNITLNLEKYGIIYNKQENYTGDEIVIFSRVELGFYPFFKGSQAVNGGLPQLADLSAHLEQATEDVLTLIPDPDFGGVGIIDWESWRPQWEQNFASREIYRKQSIKLIEERHPEWTDETTKLVAVIEFEQAAKHFMDSTLRLVKALRPSAKWGFYHYPYCYNKDTPGRVCDSEAVATNDNITWLFDSSTALYPSIYLHGSQKENAEFVSSILTEALHVRNKSQNTFVDIYPYTRYLYSHSELFFSKEDLNFTILRSAEMGCSGVVFWGSKNDTKTTASCQQLQGYLDAFLGPFVKTVTDAANLCSITFCSGNGRCVGDIIACASILEKEAGHSVKLNKRPKDWGKHILMPCSCKCYEGWHGTSCYMNNDRSDPKNPS